MNIDFKNLLQEQEDALRKLLETISHSVLSSIEKLSIPDNAAIIYSSENITVAKLKAAAVNMDPIWINHMRNWFHALETIFNMRSKKKWKLKFW